MLWNTYGNCDNYGILTGHKGAVLDLHWSRDSRVLFSASADKLLASWDLETGLRIRRHVGHEEVINCLDVSRRGEEMLVSGADDGCIGVRLPLYFHTTDPRLKSLDMGSSPKERHRLPRNRVSYNGSCTV